MRRRGARKDEEGEIKEVDQILEEWRLWQLNGGKKVFQERENDWQTGSKAM